MADPLDMDDPSVAAARRAERAAYEHYGLAFQEHFVDVEALGGRIRVVEAGSGPPVVLIPGGVGFSVDLVPLVAELTGHTAYLMDRPGGGFSDGIDHGALALQEIATTSTAALVDAFGLEGVPIVGSSMGGYWTLQFALEHPDRVSRLALLGTPALYPGETTPLPARLMTLPVVGGILLNRIQRSSSADDVREGLSFLGHPEETTAGLPGALMEATYRFEQLPHYERSWTTLIDTTTDLWGVPEDVTLTPADLRRVRSSVLLLWGTNDPFGSVEVGRAGAEHFRDAEFHVVGVGHLPWLDDPRTSGELLRGFLAGEG